MTTFAEIGREIVQGGWGPGRDMPMREHVQSMATDRMLLCVMSYFAKRLGDVEATLRHRPTPLMETDAESFAKALSKGVVKSVWATTPPPEPWPGGTISEVASELPIRARKAIARLQLGDSTSPQELEHVSQDTWLASRNCGIATLRQIREWGLKYGLNLQIDA